ncbi:AAA family ATPase [Eisenibacter elegans]|uniref:AAA family ATPase n=1 Tax=Eisenibacter elegans TaxID=997 RepID=UPI0003F6C2D6|nr:ATP-binding protein [Eisenibacter elegans]
MLHKIAITGPESTGKSTLSVALAKHYQTAFVPEFARSYLDTLGRPYVAEDLLHIAQGQLKAEHEAEPNAKNLLFCDTDMTVMHIWHTHAYGKPHPWIEAQLKKQTYSLYLLMDVDLPWEPDPLREHPQLRAYFFEIYQQTLKLYHKNYVIISGTQTQRMDNAIAEIDNFLNNC